MDYKDIFNHDDCDCGNCDECDSAHVSEKDGDELDEETGGMGGIESMDDFDNE